MAYSGPPKFKGDQVLVHSPYVQSVEVYGTYLATA